MNKLTIEEQFLNFSQAKELKYLGIDFENGNYLIWNESEEIIAKSNILGFIGDDYTPTLSVAEMLEMLPEIIKVKDVIYELYLKKSSFYIVGYREYLNESLSINEFIYTLIRDALFEMLKWLKQNKLTIEEMEFYKLVI